MTTRNHTEHDPGLIVPDEILDPDGRTRILPRAPNPADARRLGFAQRSVMVIVAIVAILIASVIAVSAAIAIAILILVRLVVRTAAELAARGRR